MEQIHKLELSKQQKRKARILRQEKCIFILSIIFFIVLLVLASFYRFVSSVEIKFINHNILFLLYIICICSMLMLNIYRGAIRRQKKKWMNHCGERITAMVIEMKSYFWRTYVSLEWCHPQTGKIYHYRMVIPRSKLKLVYGYETGSQFPLWIDLNDPGFYCPEHSFITMALVKKGLIEKARRARRDTLRGEFFSPSKNSQDKPLQ